MVIRKALILLFIASMMFSAHVEKACAAHPLVTDDTGTQGKGSIQTEIVGEYGRDLEEGKSIKSFEIPMTPFISYGVSDRLDVVVGLTYHSLTTDEGATKSTISGMTDASLELKARLYEKEGFSVAVKPGIRFPSGDEAKGLGNGRASYAFTIITTLTAGRLSYHMNLGYSRNEFKLQADTAVNRSDIWNASIAAEVAVSKDIRLIGNIGNERNPDKTSDTHPAFVLGGIVYSLRDDLDIDFGIKRGISSPETDLSLLAGAAWRY